ncbi:unnamed protein product [Phytophthora fragariaefolia]|uniref:Unnamed protein product n=1 Tax=Phytophthora fragariaefolia TaxID=1490495 RepID=A0A9W7D050_9STRA|nr:unnamed protein product [Phytophthora fragariaefolia]
MPNASISRHNLAAHILGDWQQELGSCEEAPEAPERDAGVRLATPRQQQRVSNPYTPPPAPVPHRFGDRSADGNRQSCRVLSLDAELEHHGGRGAGDGHGAQEPEAEAGDQRKQQPHQLREEQEQQQQRRHAAQHGAAPQPPRVLGLTARSNAAVAVNPVSGELAYAAGCIVVIYNLRRNKQVRYYRVDKGVACLCFSPSGQFLAIGERGYLPAITIWDGTDGTLCAELQHHQYGVACMAFSQDGRFLLSAGLVHDQHVYAWELKAKRKDAARGLDVEPVGCALVEDKILDVDYCQAGNFFVTVGQKHFKYWFLDENGSFLVTGLHVNELPELQHRDAMVNAKTSATFTGVGCGLGACELKTFAVTSDGTLCCFGASGIMERLVSLESNRGNAISVTASYVAVGGSSGVVRLFSPSTLEYRATLPFPPAFGAANEPPNRTQSSSMLYPFEPFRYPAVIATRITGSHVIVFYSDRSIFIYSIANPDAVTVERSFLYHSGGVRDLQVVGSARGVNSKGKVVCTDSGSSEGVSADIIPTGTFVTCSDDNTVRLWHLELHRRPAHRFEPPDVSEIGFWKNPYSLEMLRVIYNDHEQDFEDEHCVVLGGTSSHETNCSAHTLPTDLGRNKGLITVAVRLDQREIATGDQEGNVVVASLPLEKAVIRIGAHSSKVNCLAYSGLNADGAILMASGGKDRLIQLYDCQRGHTVLSTLESHAAAVATISFSRDARTLFSSGADNAVMISRIDAKGEVVESNSLPISDGKIFDTVLLPDTNTIVACCSNKLEIFDTNTGKQRNTLMVGEQHHLALCPANYCVAMSGSLADKTIHVLDIATGDTLATGAGHGEAVTALKFTPDCRRLLSASADGCIFVWRLADDIQSEIKARLPRVSDVQRPIPAPSRETVVGDHTSALPPPAPPIMGLNKIKNASIGASHISMADSLVPKEYPRISDAIERAKGTPMSAPKNSPPKWKGNGVAVPGPMAGIPMEDWMRTRASAKPTIQVVNSDNDYNPGSKSSPTMLTNNGALVIDRLQTPDWAKTTPPADITSPMQNSEAVKGNAHGKWSDHAVGLLHAKDNIAESGVESKVDLQQTYLQEAHNIAISPQVSNVAKTPSKDELTDLSVEVLDSSPNLSGSLALEREQLEKRKRQMDTANAVAAMNTRLSQLGLLKPPQKTTPTTQSRQEYKTNGSPSKRIKASETCTSTDIYNVDLIKATVLPSPTPAKSPGTNTVKASIPVSKSLTKESFGPVINKRSDTYEESPKSPDKVELSVASDHKSPPTVSGSNVGDMTANLPTSTENNDGGPPAEVTEQIENVENTYSNIDSGKFTNDMVDEALNALNSQEPPIPPPVDERVATSLSMHIHGYGSQLTARDNNSVEAKPESGDPTTLVVDASLSSFTMGFTSSTSTSNASMTELSMAVNASVASSLSAFTAGYGGEAKVDSSQAGAPSEMSLNESMSGYTVGYSTAAVEPAKTPENIDHIPVEVSLSNFTSGYGAAKEDTTVTPEAVRPPSVASTNSTPKPLTSTTTCSTNNDAVSRRSFAHAGPGGYRPLEDAALALDKISASRSEQDPKVVEVRELVETLRAAIAELASPS